jgi:hypothetical protein
MIAEASVSEGELKDWIREHRVTYEQAPDFEVRRHEKLVAGVELRLHAPRSGPCTSDPGGPSCHAIHEKLREIARRVAPDGVRYAVEGFDSSFHLRPEARWEPEIELVAKVLPHGETFAPADDADAAPAMAIGKALERLGVQRGKWKHA